MINRTSTLNVEGTGEIAFHTFNQVQLESHWNAQARISRYSWGYLLLYVHRYLLERPNPQTSNAELAGLFFNVLLFRLLSTNSRQRTACRSWHGLHADDAKHDAVDEGYRYAVKVELEVCMRS